MPSSSEFPPLDNTYGATLLGTFIGLMLYGLTLNQCYRYYTLYPADRTILRSMVLIVIVFETLYTVLTMHMSYFYLVTNFFNPARLFVGYTGIWSLSMLPIASCTLMMASQSFFVRRVYLLGGWYRLVAASAVLLILAQLAFYSLGTERAFTLPLSRIDDTTWPIATGNAFAFAADTVLTATLIFALHRRRTGFPRTDSIINILMIYTINTGLIAGAINLVSVLTSYLLAHTLIWVGPGIVTVRMYAISMLAALNARKSISGRGVHTFGDVDDTITNGHVNIKLEPRVRTTRFTTSTSSIHQGSHTSFHAPREAAGPANVLDIKAPFSENGSARYSTRKGDPESDYEASVGATI